MGWPKSISGSATKSWKKLLNNIREKAAYRELDRQLAKHYAVPGKRVRHEKQNKTGCLTTRCGKDIRHSALQQRTVQNRQYAGCCRRSRLDLCRGDILFIETILSESKGELKLTGNLGNVMKESASTAFTYLHANAKIRLDRNYSQKTPIFMCRKALFPKDGPVPG